MKLQAYTHITLFETLQPEWNDLVRSSTSNRIFSTWEWAQLWWQAYQPGDLWVITCRDAESNTLLGIAPWFVRNDPERGRVVSTIGCKEVTDYLDLIIHEAHVESVAAAFADYLLNAAAEFDRIAFCNIPEASVSFTHLPRLLEERGFQTQLEREDVCPVIDLPAEWDSYLERLEKKQRHEIRRKLRRVQGVDSDVDWYIVGPQHQIEEEMAAFLHMMASSDDQKARFLQDPQNTAFFKSIIPAFFEQGWLQLSFLTIAGVRAATYLNFDYNGHILVYNSGLLPDEYGHLSPGIVLLAHNIRHAIETGHQVFDFLQGDEVYKYRMGGQDTVVYNLEAFRQE